MKLKRSAPSAAMAVILATSLLLVFNVQAANTLDMNGFIGDEYAKAIALELTGGGQVTVCRLSYNQGAALYEVGVINGNTDYLFFIDAFTGNVESFTQEFLLETRLPQATLPRTPQAPQASQTTAPRTAIAPVSVAPNFRQQTLGSFLTIEEARGIALAHIGQGVVVRHETKKDGYKVCIQYGNWHYDVEIFFNGNIKKVKAREITFIAPKAFAWNHLGVIGFDAAEGIALNRAGGGVLIENKLDHKSREGLVYKVKVVEGQMEYTVEMFASNGSIFKYEAKYKP